MAILEELGLTVCVHIGGTPVPEYDDPEPFVDDIGDPAYTRVCHKYIEVKDNAEYCFHYAATGEQKWLFQTPSHAFEFCFHVDGRAMAGKIYDAKHHGTVGSSRGVGSFENGQALLRRYRFTAVNMVDDADTKRVKSDLDRAKNLGLMKVAVYRYRILGKSLAKDNRSSQDLVLSVAEKALKGRAVSHGTTLSSAVKDETRYLIDGERLDSSARPYAIFYFKYRSKDALRAEMILPRSPSPALSIDGLDRDEVQRLARERLAEIKRDKHITAKREFNDVFDLTGDAAAPRRPLKIRRRRDGKEIIDLTDG